MNDTVIVQVTLVLLVYVDLTHKSLLYATIVYQSDSRSRIMLCSLWWLTVHNHLALWNSVSNHGDQRFNMSSSDHGIIALRIIIHFTFSLSVSSADVASSSNSIFGLRINALAIATRCFWPPLSCAPLSPTFVS